jgi:hypothetical protein
MLLPVISRHVGIASWFGHPLPAVLLAAAAVAVYGALWELACRMKASRHAD